MRIRGNYVGLVVSGVASVSVGFGAKKDRGTGFSVLTTGEMEREPKNEREGRGRGRKEGNKRLTSEGRECIQAIPNPISLRTSFISRRNWKQWSGKMFGW